MKRLVCLVGILVCIWSVSGCSAASSGEILDSDSIQDVIGLYPIQLSKLVKYSIEREGSVWKGSFYFQGDLRRDAQLITSDIMLSCFSKAYKVQDRQFVYASKVMGKPLDETWQRTETVVATVFLDGQVVSSQYINLDISKKWGTFKSFESIRQEIKGRKNRLYDLTRYGQTLVGSYRHIQSVLFEDGFERQDSSNSLIMRIQSDGFILSEEELASFCDQVLNGVKDILNKNNGFKEPFRFYILFQDHGSLGTTMTYSSGDDRWTKGLVEDEKIESNQVYRLFVR